MSSKGLTFGMFLLTAGPKLVELCCFLDALLLLVVKVDAVVEVHEEALEGLLNDLAVIVTSGFETKSFCPGFEPASLDLDLAAAANTSAMLLLKVSGIADEPELSVFLNS